MKYVYYFIKLFLYACFLSLTISISSIKVSSADFQKWAEEIVSVFKHETTSTYYVLSNAKQKRLANRKLWDKYNNLIKYIKTQAVKNTEEKTPSENADYKEALLTLRAIQPDDSNLLKL